MTSPPHKAGFLVSEIMPPDDTAPNGSPNEAAGTQNESTADRELARELSDLDGEQDAESKKTPKKDEPAGESDGGTEDDDGDHDGDESDAGQQDGDEDDDGDDGDEDADDKPKKPSRSERYKRQIARLQAENRDLAKRAPTSGGMSETEIAVEVEKRIGKPPKLEDFNGDYAVHAHEMSAYLVDKRQTTREVTNEANSSKAKAEERQAELALDHQDRVKEFAKKHAKDFDAVVKAADLKASPAVESLLLESDLSANLVYFFAKNPGTLNRINGMGEREAAREIGRLENRIQSSLSPPRTKTGARKPALPLKGGAAAKSTATDQTDDLNRWLKKQYGE